MMKMQCRLKFLDIFLHILLWIALSIITFGLAAFVYPYSFARFLVNGCFLADSSRNVFQLNSKIKAGENILHILLWIFITVITLGLGYVFYLYYVWIYALNRAELVEITP